MKPELPLTVKIEKTIEEAHGIKSFLVPCTLNAKPGQFIMVWLPGVDARPVGVSYQENSLSGFTVSAVGPWSKSISELKAGDLVGILGPYGNGFELNGKSVVMLGGGYGTASLMLLAEQAVSAGIDATIVIGAKNESSLLYRERVKALGLNAVFTTDDGSFGTCGFNTEVLESILSERRVDTVYACGPELMEKRVAEICKEHSVNSQISLERYMKCGFGVCGACCMDDTGERVCVEGPVFSGEKLLKLVEFGKYHRDGSAHKHSF